MVDSSVRFQPSTLPEAARILGVSESTVRRLVKAGKLEAERVLRPQGHVWMVRVPAPSTDPPDDPPRWIGASPANPPDPAATPPALAAWSETFLLPLVAALERQAGRVAELERENGELRAEKRALLASTAPQSLEPTTEAPAARPAPTTWVTPRRFWSIAAILLVLVGVGVVQVTVMLFSLAVQLAMPQ